MGGSNLFCNDVKAITDKGIDYQLASPNDHCLNPAESAIQTFKNHLITILHDTNKHFQAWRWCQILHQVVITLNMLRRLRIKPKLLAYEQIFGVFDYNQTPLAPIGTKSVVHVRTTQKGRSTFGDNGVIGWTIGPAMDHYRHWCFYIPKTRSTRVSDTVVFLPAKYSMPTTASSDRAATALEELTEALKHPQAAKPFLDTGNNLNAAIDPSSEIFSKKQSTTTGASPPRVTPPRVSDSAYNINNKHQFRTSSRTKVQTSSQTKIQKFPLRTTVYKNFEYEIHQGYICGFDTIEGFYKINYRDGDIEVGDENDIAKLLKPPNKTSWNQALAASRFERVQHRYCQLEEAMPVPSKFSNGFGKAIAFLDYQEGQAFIPNQQEYKYKACAVIDETTGKSMEYRDLVEDPKHKATWCRAAANEFGRLFNGAGTNEDGTKRIAGTNTC